MESIQELVKKKGRIFIIPRDHLLGEDTKKLEKTGIQNFVDSIDSFGHEGYIFHSRLGYTP